MQALRCLEVGDGLAEVAAGELEDELEDLLSVSVRVVQRTPGSAWTPSAFAIISMRA